MLHEEDNLNMHGHVLMDLAEVLRLADRRAEAGYCVEEALEVYERKGNTVSATVARTFRDA